MISRFPGRYRSVGPRGRAARPIPVDTAVSFVMSRVVSARPDMRHEDAMALLLEHDLSAAPVIDTSGRLVGMLSMTDLLREIQDRGNDYAARSARGKVGQIMLSAFPLRASASIADAAALMAYEGVRDLPIVDDAGIVVGVVNASTIMRGVGQRAAPMLPARDDSTESFTAYVVPASLRERIWETARVRAALRGSAAGVVDSSVPDGVHEELGENDHDGWTEVRIRVAGPAKRPLIT
jgi:CBS domain-containing protein